jgi:uncharacterized membrane protein (UPF0182 family)
MRAPTDIPPRHFSLASHRARWVIGIFVAVLVVLLVFSHNIASFYTNILWYGSVGFTSVWVKTFTIQLGLACTFTAVLFALIWSNLSLAERLAPLSATLSPGDSLVSRWQELTFGRTRWIRLLVTAFFALIGGISAHSQWVNWSLFSNAQPFTSASAPSGGVDPLNHLNDGFYVFRLPFLNWVTGWLFSALVVTFLLCLVAHYLNGGIRPHAAMERVSPKVKAHLSVLLAVLALVEGSRYYLERLSLVLSTKYVVDGATYTDVHATRPALLLLVAISVIAAGLFLYNARQQGWLLPAVGAALWGLVWVLVANVYPALVQSLVVNPSENVKEQPYIQDNITATTWSYGLEGVITQAFQGGGTVTAAQVTGKSPQSLANEQSLANVPLLDAGASGMNSVFTKQQGFRPYYTMSGPSTDRYDLPGPNGRPEETQVLISARELDPGGAPGSWVSQHLQYTHGYGAVVAPADQKGVDPSDGYPKFSLAGLPPAGEPALTGRPQIYFSANPQLSNGYVIADSDQTEVDYENPASGNQVESHYAGSGGVKVGGFFRRLAFALSFGDYNIFISGQVDSSSRILYHRNVVQALQKVAPFLTYDSNPYPVIDNGSVYWVVDAYTTSDNFPYSQQANTDRLPASSELANERFNYIRNSVKAVVDAYTGKMWFFVQDPTDPVLETWRQAFPALFTPMSEADREIPGITAHWRYPEDFFVVQTNMWQRYHQQDPSVFYQNVQGWGIPENPAAGEVAAASTSVPTFPVTQPARAPAPASVMPLYELVALPGQTQQSFVLVQPFVPATAGNRQSQVLASFMTASSDPNDYGQLTDYTIPSGQSVDGPYLVSTAVDENNAISQEITLLNHDNSKVVLGNVIITPVGQSLIYTQPLYVEQTANQVPSLRDVIVVYNGAAFHSGATGPSLDAALCNVTNPDGSHPFSTYCPGATSRGTARPGSTPSTAKTKAPTTTTTTTTPPVTTPRTKPAKGTVASDLAAAERYFMLANAALKQGDLASYQSDIRAGEALVAQADQLASTAAGATKRTATARTGAGSRAGPAGTRRTTGSAGSGGSLRAQPLAQRSAAT